MNESICIKTKSRRISIVFVALLLGVTVCSCSTGKSSSGEQIQDELSSLPERWAADSDKISNFSKGEIESFKASNGYKNADPMFGCVWSRHNVSFQDGIMNLSVTEKNGTYYGAEYTSYGGAGNWGYNYYHGFYSVCMKAAKKSGVISSFFVYNGNPWNEIDIEFLGKDTTKVQFNYFINGVGGHEYLYSLGFDASEEFHEYSFDWTQESITWYVDGKAVYRATENIPAENVYERLMMNTWNGCGESFNRWAGQFSDEGLPVSAQYEWIAYQAKN